MEKHEHDDAISDAESLTPEQWSFLKEFSANYVAGRRIGCWIARGIVGLGMVAGAVAAVVALVMQFRGH
jgi:uncharacterized membrane protein